jgi:hypothetical protein
MGLVVGWMWSKLYVGEIGKERWYMRREEVFAALVMLGRIIVGEGDGKCKREVGELFDE